MKAPDFSYEKPNSIPGILSLLEKDELECQLLAGGQSLMPMMNFRMATPKTIVDISGVSELSLITDTPKAIEIGAMVRFCELQDSGVIQKFCPLITMVIPHIAHPAIRNRGTIGGSIGLSDPAAELPAVLLALDGKVEVSSNKGIREEPANKFFKGVYETACSSNELITKIILPKAQPKQKFGFYEIAHPRLEFCSYSANFCQHFINNIRQHLPTFRHNFVSMKKARVAERSASCRSRQHLSNECLVTNVGLDESESEPCEVCPLSLYRSLTFQFHCESVVNIPHTSIQ